jgi:hypothetical protein
MIELQPSKRATYAESLGNFVMLLVAFRHGCLAACYRFRRYTSRLALDLLFLGPLQNRIDCLLSATFEPGGNKVRSRVAASEATVSAAVTVSGP